MRTASGAELALLASATVNHHVRIEVKNGSGTWKDLTNLSGLDWVDGWEIDGEAIDRPVATAKIELRRDSTSAGAARSLAPLWGASPLNVDDSSAYSPLLDIGRAVRITTAVTASGVAPVAADWKEMFLGRINAIDWQASPITVDCSDSFAWIVDRYIETISTYGSNSGESLEALIQDFLNGWPPFGGAPTLYTPSPSGWVIPASFLTTKKSVAEMLKDLVDQIAWELRYRYDASGVSRLTLFQPPRNKTISDATLGPAIYRGVHRLNLAIDDVRNAVVVNYITGGTSPQTTLSQDTISQGKYGKRYMELPGGTNIHFAVDAQALGDAAVNDLGAPKADQEVELLYYWPAQLYDLYTFSANADHYDSAQQLAVIGVKHAGKNGEIVTTLTTRGKVAGAYSGWLRRAASLPVSPLVPRLQPFTYVDTETTRTYTWTRNAVTNVVWVYDNLVQVGVADPYDVATSFPTIVLAVGTDTYTATKPVAGFQRALHFVPRDVTGVAGDVRHEALDPSPSALAGAVKVVRAIGAGTADLTLSIFGSASNWPVSYVLHEDTPDGLVILSGSVSAVTTILPASYPGALLAQPLPKREMKRWYLVLTDVAGVIVEAHGQTDRDPMPSGSATTGDYRTNPFITSSYDTDVDTIRVTVPGGKIKTFPTGGGSGTWTYTVGDALDDTTREAAFLTDEVRTPYLVELQGGGAWVTEFTGPLHGVSSKPAVVIPRVVLSTNGDTADLYCVIQSPTAEACTLLFRDSESLGAPEYALCASGADATPRYIAYGVEVGPLDWFTLSAVQAHKLAAIPLTRDQIIRRYVCAQGQNSGVRSSWHAIPLSLKAQPWLESVALSWDVSSGNLLATVKGGANCLSVLLEIDDAAGFDDPYTFSASLADGATVAHSFALSNAERGTVWYLRATPYNQLAGGGLTGADQRDSTVVPPIFTYVIVPTKASGQGTLTVTINDPNSKLHATNKVSFAVTTLGVRALVAATSNTAGAGTTGDYLYGPFTLDPKHAIVVEPLIHLADGTTVQPGGETFDANLVANCLNVDVVHVASTATVTATFDTDTVTGAALTLPAIGPAQYSIAGAAWVNVAVDATKRNSVFTVPMLATTQSVRVQGVNSAGTAGPIMEGVVGTIGGSAPLAQNPVLTIGARKATNAGLTGPPYNQLDITFTYSGMPSGTTFDVSYNNGVANGMDSGNFSGASPITATFSTVTFGATPGRGIVTVTAKYNGAVIATAVKGSPDYLT